MKNNSCLIVLNYNGIVYLKSNLNELFKLCERSEVDFFVGDDNSTDESITHLKQNSIPHFLNTGQNKGYAANLNNVLKNLVDKGYQEFIVANSDIEISEDFFQNYKLTLKSLRKINNWGLLGFTEINESFKKQNLTSQECQVQNKVKTIKGFLYVINLKLIHTIGYFDESYFMYGEDNDYFYRTQKAGFAIYESPIKVFHYSEGSELNLKKNSWLAYRNSIMFARKNLNRWGYLKLMLSIIHIIYNPFYKKNDPSVNRLRRSGFIENHIFFYKSIVWNFKNK